MFYQKVAAARRTAIASSKDWTIAKSRTIPGPCRTLHQPIRGWDGKAAAGAAALVERYPG